MSLLKLDDNSEIFNNFSKYQKELENKDQQIIELQNKINNLLEKQNQNFITQQHNNDIINNNQKFQNNELKSNISFQKNISQNHLLSLILILQQENTLLKNKLNKDHKIEDKYSDTVQYKLLRAKTEIENLTKMNNNKDNIIMNMQNFINNINILITNNKINLNINQIGIKTFIDNLKELEQKILSKFEKIQKISKIPQSQINKRNQNLLKKPKKEPGFNKLNINKKYFYRIPINKNVNKSIIFITKNFISNKSLNTTNNLCEKCAKNINEYKDIRCSTCRKKSKNNEKFYKERKKLRLKGFLLTKPEGIFSRTPKKIHIKSKENKYYNEYLKNITSENTISNFINENSSFK
jgi:hypothetical protein